MPDPAFERFLSAEAECVSPPLVPELRLWTAPALTPFWVAAEARFGRMDSPFWAFAWAGGQALARYLLDHPELVAGRSVLDVGCGGGVAAIAAARAGARAVANDIDPMATRAALVNAAENACTITPNLADRTGSSVHEDIVIVGDLCYHREAAARLVPWLVRLAHSHRVLLADPGRAFAPTSGLRELARYTVPTTWDLEGRTTRDTRVVEILPDHSPPP